MKSEYISRFGNLNCSTGEAFYFATDIRNLKRFVPAGSVSNLKFEQDSCSFDVSMLGTVNLAISEKVPTDKVLYSGEALNVNDFSINLEIIESENKKAKVKITFRADINPLFKMVAEKPIAQMLESIINGMEKFDGWKDVTG